MNRNLKIFLASAFPFGIFIGILFSPLYGLRTGIISGLIAGLIFGIVMFFILGTLHSRAVRKVAGEESKASLNTYQTRNITLQISFDRAFDLCVRSLHVINRCKVQKMDHSEGKIIAGSSINWKTWGDTISFDIDRTGTEYTNVKVSSSPTSWTTIVDYGKNLENVEAIVSFLKKYAGVAATVPN